MSLHTKLAIYKDGTALLSLALDVQTQIPRAFRTALGAKITEECTVLLVLIARANAARGSDRAMHIHHLLEHLEVMTFLLRVSHDKRLIAPKLWASSIALTDSIGKQAATQIIATHADVICTNGIKDQYLTYSCSIGYTPAVTSKKDVIGCRSPMARGAKPHPARFAAFSFQATSFGSPDGRASALPETLRVPRSPTPVRAAAQCRSWSAVVHQAQLEIIMDQNTYPHAIDLGVRIVLKPFQNESRWIGTRAELEAEGFIPAAQDWPEKPNKTTSFHIGNQRFYIRTSKWARGGAANSFYITVYHDDGDARTNEIQAKVQEIAKLAERAGTQQWTDRFEQHYRARTDLGFQEFKRKLLGQKKRGRAARTTRSTEENT